MKFNWQIDRVCSICVCENNFSFIASLRSRAKAQACFAHIYTLITYCQMYRIHSFQLVCMFFFPQYILYHVFHFNRLLLYSILFWFWLPFKLFTIDWSHQMNEVVKFWYYYILQTTMAKKNHKNMSRVLLFMAWTKCSINIC